MTASLTGRFACLHGPRVERNRLSPLMEILRLVVCAMLGGAEVGEAMAEFGKEKGDCRRQFAPFANGIPLRDCIVNASSRLFAQTPPAFAKAMPQRFSRPFAISA